ncbi:MAG: PEP-CTERM sorting domain-containing protein [Planctomycetota bacterium]|nr:PEP-CTERM sorting domain-containing protein [Planctomycetota bacterium]
MKTTRTFILWTLAGCLLLPASAGADYFSPVAEFPPPCMKEYDKSSPILYQNGLQIRNLVATRTGLGAAMPTQGNGAAISSFFDIYLEVSTDGGGSWSDGVDNDCDSFFDIFTEVTVGPGGAGGAQGWSGLRATIPTPLGAVMIRESPTRAGGRFTATPIPGGYMIDSFFDIYTEVSTDGGGSWSPQITGPTRMVGVPEPATLSLLALGGLAVIRRKRRARHFVDVF